MSGVFFNHARFTSPAHIRPWIADNPFKSAKREVLPFVLDMDECLYLAPFPARTSLFFAHQKMKKFPWIGTIKLRLPESFQTFTFFSTVLQPVRGADLKFLAMFPL